MARGARHTLIPRARLASSNNSTSHLTSQRSPAISPTNVIVVERDSDESARSFRTAIDLRSPSPMRQDPTPLKTARDRRIEQELIAQRAVRRPIYEVEDSSDAESDGEGTPCGISGRLSKRPRGDRSYHDDRNHRHWRSEWEEPGWDKSDHDNDEDEVVALDEAMMPVRQYTDELQDIIPHSSPILGFAMPSGPASPVAMLSMLGGSEQVIDMGWSAVSDSGGDVVMEETYVTTVEATSPIGHETSSVSLVSCYPSDSRRTPPLTPPFPPTSGPRSGGSTHMTEPPRKRVPSTPPLPCSPPGMGRQIPDTPPLPIATLPILPTQWLVSSTSSRAPHTCSNTPAQYEGSVAEKALTARLHARSITTESADQSFRPVSRARELREKIAFQRKTTIGGNVRPDWEQKADENSNKAKGKQKVTSTSRDESLPEGPPAGPSLVARMGRSIAHEANHALSPWTSLPPSEIRRPESGSDSREGSPYNVSGQTRMRSHGELVKAPLIDGIQGSRKPQARLTATPHIVPVDPASSRMILPDKASLADRMDVSYANRRRAVSTALSASTHKSTDSPVFGDSDAPFSDSRNNALLLGFGAQAVELLVEEVKRSRSFCLKDHEFAFTPGVIPFRLHLEEVIISMGGKVYEYDSDRMMEIPFLKGKRYLISPDPPDKRVEKSYVHLVETKRVGICDMLAAITVLRREEWDEREKREERAEKTLRERVVRESAVPVVGTPEDPPLNAETLSAINGKSTLRDRMAVV